MCYSKIYGSRVNLIQDWWMPSILFFILLCITSCESSSHTTSYTWQEFACRDEGIPTARYALYRAKVPSSWVRKDPFETESLADTMKPLSEFYIEEDIRLTVHNFPSDKMENRIPPMAQINRWTQQFDELDPLNTSVTSESHGGFVGLFLEGEGTLKGKPTKILGWSMQIAPEYYTLVFDKQKKADYTIKVLGPPQLVEAHRESLVQFANSFELIEELP